ncbi:MAG: hypothetical protein MJZ72_06615 [Bacteroidales bacterium]|nr:hypothetical protein [Bacteroidales bacterium]
MKKYFVIIAAVVLAFAFTSCDKNSKPYNGTYVGTYSFFKAGGQSSDPDSTRTNKKLPVLQLSDASVSVYDVIPLSKESEGIYKTSQEGGALLSTLLGMIGVGQSTTEKINAVKMTADFTVENKLTFTVSYDVELGIGAIEVRVLQFEGTKKEK